MEVCCFTRYSKTVLFWPSKDEYWLGTHDSHAPVSQAELIKKLHSRNSNDKNITTTTSSAVGWLIDHIATLNKTSKDKEKWSKRLNILNYYGTGRVLVQIGEGSALSIFQKLHATACTCKLLSVVLPTMPRAEQTSCDVNLLAWEALLALGNHLPRGTLLLLSSSANVTETLLKANINTEFQMYINKISVMFSISLKVRAAMCGWESWAKQLRLWVICEEQNWFQLVLARTSQHTA